MQILIAFRVKIIFKNFHFISAALPSQSVPTIKKKIIQTEIFYIKANTPLKKARLFAHGNIETIGAAAVMRNSLEGYATVAQCVKKNSLHIITQ